MQMLQYFNTQMVSPHPPTPSPSTLSPNTLQTDVTSESLVDEDTSQECIGPTKKMKKISPTKKSLIPSQMNRFNGDLFTVCMLGGTLTYGDFLLRCRKISKGSGFSVRKLTHNLPPSYLSEGVTAYAIFFVFYLSLIIKSSSPFYHWNSNCSFFSYKSGKRRFK